MSVERGAMKSILSTILFIFTAVSVAPAQSVDSAAVGKTLFTAFNFGNLHGVGLGIEYRVHPLLSAEGSFGIKSPVEILLGPPFQSDRINLLGTVVVRPVPWLFVNGGMYFGMYRLTEYLWISAPVLSAGVRMDRFDIEAGAAFRMPVTIYTQTRVRYDETIGAGETRISPAGPTFPFFKLTYRAK
jgi:hypothetical protein